MIGQIENEIVKYINTLNDAGVLGYKIRVIKTYSGELRSQKDRAGLKDFPAIWLAFDGAAPVHETSSYIKLKARFMLLVAAENLRNEKAARHGAAGDVGAYQLCEDMMGVLHGKTPGSLECVGKIDRMSIRPLSVDDTRNGRLAIYGLPFEIDFQVKKSSPENDDQNQLSAIHTNWDLPPNYDVGPDLPDDENADATSHITGE
ncbi:MAG: hypothetical protein CMP22_07290 [Rickettsiales bacterium]|nr:hypothetical protein [Rickettsiales bacterium]|tara:strand:- start:779 stop:1387 length:609 start_codon:yes stop_codon:yes gene_type:complete